jgi:hypothetical protein
MIMVRLAIASFALATVCTGLSTLVSTRATAIYPGIMDCERGCQVAAAGWPVPFVIDYPGASPAGSADLLGLMLGIDILNSMSLLYTFLTWLLFSILVQRIWARRSTAVIKR